MNKTGNFSREIEIIRKTQKEILKLKNSMSEIFENHSKQHES